MKTIEDRVRHATRAAANTIAPGTQPRLRLPGTQPSRRLTRLRRPRSLAAWAVPAMAAAAAVGIIAASLTVPEALLRRGGHHGAASAAAAARGLPAYYVGLTGDLGQQKSAVIRATATGRVLATVRPPKPYGVFDYITAAGDDRTFVVAVQRWWPIKSGTRGLPAEERDNTTPMKFFWLRIQTAARPARPVRLAPLRIPGTLQAAQVGGIGLSPDASKLAMTVQPRTSSGTRSTIRVVTLATGAWRQWHWHGGGWVGNWKPMGQPLSWSADSRTLAFQQWGGKNDDAITRVRVLDTATPGDSLSSARIVTTFHNNNGSGLKFNFGNTVITPDGTKIIAATYSATAHGIRLGSQITEFSARTGAVVRTMGRHGGPTGVVWTDRTGDRLIVSVGYTGKFAVVAGGTVTPLPSMPMNVATVVW
jgi:hypothetical protein